MAFRERSMKYLESITILSIAYPLTGLICLVIY